MGTFHAALLKFVQTITFLVTLLAIILAYSDSIKSTGRAVTGGIFAQITKW